MRPTEPDSYYQTRRLDRGLRSYAQTLARLSEIAGRRQLCSLLRIREPRGDGKPRASPPTDQCPRTRALGNLRTRTRTSDRGTRLGWQPREVADCERRVRRSRETPD